MHQLEFSVDFQHLLLFTSSTNFHSSSADFELLWDILLPIANKLLYSFVDTRTKLIFSEASTYILWFSATYPYFKIIGIIPLLAHLEYYDAPFSALFSYVCCRRHSWAGFRLWRFLLQGWSQHCGLYLWVCNLQIFPPG